MSGDPMKLTRLEPDAKDIDLAATVAFKPCPFCGRQPIVFHEQNDATGYIVSRAACTGCHASQHYCGRTRDEARSGVIAAWDRRITNFLDDCVVVPREPRPEAVASWWKCKNNGGSDYDAYRALVASVAGK